MASAALLPRLLLLTLVMSLVAVAAGGDNSTAAGQIRINCGASVSATDSDGRAWDGDAASKFAPSVAGVEAGASYEDPSLPSTVRYMTAAGHACSTPATPTPGDMVTKPVPTFANGGLPDPTPIRADSAFQTMYRFNVGVTGVSPGDDSTLLYRSWDDDSVGFGTRKSQACMQIG